MLCRGADAHRLTSFALGLDHVRAGLDVPSDFVRIVAGTHIELIAAVATELRGTCKKVKWVGGWAGGWVVRWRCIGGALVVRWRCAGGGWMVGWYRSAGWWVMVDGRRVVWWRPNVPVLPSSSVPESYAPSSSRSNQVHSALFQPLPNLSNM